MRRIEVIVLAAALASVAGNRLEAQRRPREPENLHGSPASVDKMYEFALQHRLPFYLTQTNVDSAIADGRLVALTGDSTYELTKGVGFAYSTREAKQFVVAFAPQYLTACGAPLNVSSAVRPTNKQPHNANPHSVHPTGIAVDIRRPYAGPCLDWVRGALAELERRGIVEATEEHHPVHLHVAVLVPPGGRVVLPNLAAGMVAARPAPAAKAVVAAGDVKLAANHRTAYTVREGDTLWDIASRLGVSIDAIRKANVGLSKALRPGTTLIIPERPAL